LLIFDCDENHNYCRVSGSDITLNLIPRDPPPEPSGSPTPPTDSSSNPNSSNSIVPTLRLLLLSVFIGIGALLHRQVSILNIVVAVAILACIANAESTSFREEFEQSKEMKDFGRWLNEVADKEAFGERGPAVNWTWNSFFGGPTCMDKTNYTIVDINYSLLEPVFAGVRKYFETVYAQTNSQTCFGYGVTYNGKVIQSDFIGRIKKDSEVRPDENTVISIGSVTKIFTSWMLASMVDKGYVSWTDPLTKFFNDNNKPAFSVVNPYNEKAGADSVTLESLASQTSGLPRECMCHFYQECD